MRVWWNGRHRGLFKKTSNFLNLTAGKNYDRAYKLIDEYNIEHLKKKEHPTEKSSE